MDLIPEILVLNRRTQRLLRLDADSWLRVNLPMGSLRALVDIDSEGMSSPGKNARDEKRKHARLSLPLQFSHYNMAI